MFHRLNTPSYFIPAGTPLPPNYDYINNAAGTGTPVPVGGPLASGPNIGSYFIGFGEDARSSAANRPVQALSENTDALDDLIHRDVALPRVTGYITAASAVSSIVIPGPMYVGEPGLSASANSIRKFVQVVDNYDNEIYDSANNEVAVTAITGANPGDYFSVGDVTLTISPPIPAGTIYRVFYSTRGSVASLIAGDVVDKQRQYGRFHGAGAWYDGSSNGPVTTVRQLTKIIADLAGTSGAYKIGSAAAAGTPYSLSVGSVRGQLGALLGALNSLYNTYVNGLAALQAQVTTNLNDSLRVRSLNAAGTINTPSKDSYVNLRPTSGGFLLTLPVASAAKGQKIFLVNDTGSMSEANPVTLTRPDTAVKINGLAKDFDLIAPYGKWILTCDGTSWNLI